MADRVAALLRDPNIVAASSPAVVKAASLLRDAAAMLRNVDTLTVEDFSEYLTPAMQEVQRRIITLTQTQRAPDVAAADRALEDADVQDSQA